MISVTDYYSLAFPVYIALLDKEQGHIEAGEESILLELGKTMGLEEDEIKVKIQGYNPDLGIEKDLKKFKDKTHKKLLIYDLIKFVHKKKGTNAKTKVFIYQIASFFGISDEEVMAIENKAGRKTKAVSLEKIQKIIDEAEKGLADKSRTLKDVDDKDVKKVLSTANKVVTAGGIAAGTAAGITLVPGVAGTILGSIGVAGSLIGSGFAAAATFAATVPIYGWIAAGGIALTGVGVGIAKKKQKDDAEEEGKKHAMYQEAIKMQNEMAEELMKKNKMLKEKGAAKDETIKELKERVEYLATQIATLNSVAMITAPDEDKTKSKTGKKKSE